MRKIKFRAWNVYKNKMYHNVQNICDLTSPPGVLDVRFGYLLDDENWKVMQYTGLKDMNGKEIYEGDIIDIHQTVNGCNLFVIVWKDIGFSGLYLIDGEMSREYEYDIKELLEVNVNKYDKEIEVIGNIRENPELLEGKEMKPILFNTEMVQAILEGRKTVTRRCIKPKYGNTHFEYRTDKYGTQFVEMQNDEEGVTYGKHEDGSCWRGMKGFLIPKSKYEVGDILYVQETWKIDSVAKHLNNMLIDFKAVKNGYSQSEVSVNLSKERFDKFKKFYQKNGWKSPCSMPKETARIFLRVTDVRVEHLQDMYLKDFLNEGIMVREESFNDPENAYYQAKEFFRKLWNSTIKKAELNQYGWDANPYVFAYEFEVISKEEAMKESEEE